MSAVLTAVLTNGPGVTASFTVELTEELLAGFVDVPRWDGPEVVNTLCAVGILSPEDFGGQGELIGWELADFDVTARITLPRPLLEPFHCGTERARSEVAEGYCDRHGTGWIVEAGESAGFTGMPIYWETLSCGCQDVDASADNIEAVR